jgi:hypothetical protein
VMVRGDKVDIGESLVGAYMRQVRGCHMVAFDTFLPNSQGEIDVIGVANALDGVKVWVAEVAIHLNSLDYRRLLRDSREGGVEGRRCPGVHRSGLSRCDSDNRVVVAGRAVGSSRRAGAR